jgi:dTDP-glucose pyrophosphorylase
MWGIVPAAGRGTRIQPLGFSKELLPVGCQHGGDTRPRAVAEYLLERMALAGADKICFVISPGKSDIMEYFGGSYGNVSLAYVVQPQASGLCDAIFRAHKLIAADEPVIIGLPDTIWFPQAALSGLPDDRFSFLLFPVERPELFDAVLMDAEENVLEIQVKRPAPDSHWIWGAFKMPGHTFAALHRLWMLPERGDEYVGTLVNAFLRDGGHAMGVKAGHSYFDVGTLEGYRAAMRACDQVNQEGTAADTPVAAWTAGTLLPPNARWGAAP